MKEIISGGREASGGFFHGGLGGNAHGDWETYGCWRKHACLDSLNASGIDTTGDAICYKFNSAQHSWLLPSTLESLSHTPLIFSPPSSLLNLPCSLSDFASHTRLLWGLQSSLKLQCSSDRAPGVGGEDAEPSSSSSSSFSSSSSSSSSSSQEHGELWGFPLTAPRVRYVSNHSFPLAELSRTLTPIAGYDAGVYNFTSDKISIDQVSLKYNGGVLGPDGNIVFVPHMADNIGIFDPSDRSFTTIDITVGGKWNGKYSGGVLGSDGKIVFVPFNTGILGIFDPSDRSFTTIDISDQISGDNTYSGGVLGPDGKIVFVPAKADHIGIFDPSDRSFTAIDISNKISGSSKYFGGVLGPDGKIVFVPHHADNIGIFDPSDRSFTTIDISGTFQDKIYYKHYGGVLGPDGKIVFVPARADYIGILELGNQDLAYEVSGGIPAEWNALLSPHFNKF